MDDLKAAKADLFECIASKHGINSWSVYWNAYKNYIVGELSRQEFESVVRSLLCTDADMELHNTFVELLLQNMSGSDKTTN